MPSWRDEYLSSLKDADLSHPVNMELTKICSQMADRISALEAEKSTLVSGSTRRHPSSASASSPNPNDAVAAQTRLELAEALRSKGVAEKRLQAAEEELDALREKAKKDANAIRRSNNQEMFLSRKLNDKEFELEEKKKLISRVQDEMITLELQLSLMETDRDRFKRENKELVARWMKRIGQEADAMNLANER